MSADFAHELTAHEYGQSTHATAVARLAGAREQHTLTPAMAALIEGILRRHPEDCVGVRHITGRVECMDYRAVLPVLGLS